VKTKLIHINDHGVKYTSLMFVCPGCKAGGRKGNEGLHMLPVNSPHIDKLSWEWDGNLESPTLSPSIRTRGGYAGSNAVCHSFLKAGVFDFLTDSTHPLSGQKVPIPDLPTWAEKDADDTELN
jgi:hypothetical protein